MSIPMRKLPAPSDTLPTNSGDHRSPKAWIIKIQMAMADARIVEGTLSNITVLMGPVDWNRKINEITMQTMLKSVFSVRNETNEKGTASSIEITNNLA